MSQYDNDTVFQHMSYELPIMEVTIDNIVYLSVHVKLSMRMKSSQCQKFIFL